MRAVLPAADQVEQIAGPEQGLGDVDFAQRRCGRRFPGRRGRRWRRRPDSPDARCAGAGCGRRASGRWRFPAAWAVSCPEHGLARCCISLGRLVGKGDGQDAIGGDAMPDQLGDAVGDHSGLARAGPRQDQQRPGKRVDGLFLWRIEFHALDRKAGLAWAKGGSISGTPNRRVREANRGENGGLRTESNVWRIFTFCWIGSRNAPCSVFPCSTHPTNSLPASGKILPSTQCVGRKMHVGKTIINKPRYSKGVIHCCGPLSLMP